MHVKKAVGWVAALCALLLSPIASCSQSDPERFDVELHEVRDARSGQGNVYFVRLFDGLVPVPKRYVLIGRASGVHELNSFDLPGAHSSVSGVIRLGSLDNYEAVRKSYSADRFKVTETSRGRVVVERLVPIGEKGRSGSGITHVIVRGDKEFLLVADENGRLWEAMLDGCSCSAK